MISFADKMVEALYGNPEVEMTSHTSGVRSGLEHHNIVTLRCCLICCG